MSVTRRITGYLLALLLAFSGQAHAQLGLTHAGKALSTAGGGGGGDTVAVNNSVATFTDGTANGTTGSVTPGGSNRALFMGVSALDFGSLSTIDDAKYGGSGGTSLTKFGSDLTYNFGSGGMAAWGIAGSPNSATTIFGDWSLTPARGYIAGVFLENVNQTTPFSGTVTNTGADGDTPTTLLTSVTVTGMTAGQKAIAAVACSVGSGAITPFTAGADTTIVVQTTDLVGGVAILYGTATGTSLTLSANCNQSSGNYITWAAVGVRINP